MPTVQAKLDQTLDTTWTKTGDKISAVLQADATAGDRKLPKGTKISGTVLRAVKQDKQHPNSGVVLSFDTATLKDGSTLPVKVLVAAIYPSHSDEVEQVEAGSGDITDAVMRTANVFGELDDPNAGHNADTRTSVHGIRCVSHIKGVVLSASPTGKASAIAVALTGPLMLDKWTRMDLVITPQ